MQFTFSEELQQLIDRRFATGRYSSRDELLRCALLSLDDYDECVAAIQAGIDDEAAGRVIPADQAIAEIRRNLNLPN